MQRVRGRRGSHSSELEKALCEADQAERIQRAVRDAEHYLYLKRKFGPRGPGSRKEAGD
jgi:hypothetical protein